MVECKTWYTKRRDALSRSRPTFLIQSCPAHLQSVAKIASTFTGLVRVKPTGAVFTTF